MIYFIRNNIVQDKKYTSKSFYLEILFQFKGLKVVNSTLKEIPDGEYIFSGIHVANTILLA